jgi:hypothetical protein
MPADLYGYGVELTDSEVRLLVARSLAIQDYGTLEQSLCRLFTLLSETPEHVAATVFFRLTNSASRLAILDQLMRLKYGSAHRAFFNSLVRMLKPMDAARNEIVHWHTVQVVGSGVHEHQLQPPNFWVHTPTTPFHNANGLAEFSVKCDYVARATNIFTWVLSGQPPDLPEGLHELCRQPLAYPPPPHGLSVRRRGAPDAQPQP